MTQTVRFELNGQARTFTGEPMRRLLDVLREDLGLTGTKEGCGEGECGACTVLLDGEPVCSCLVPMVQVDGRTVRSVEGLLADGRLSRLQQVLVDEGGVQCGACTPGIVVTAEALLRDTEHPSRRTIQEALAGNLCRCTGYERIFLAIEKASEST